LLALYNNGFIERLPSLYNFWCHFTRFVFVFPAALPHRAPKTKAYSTKRPGRKSNSRHTSSDADALTTRSRAGWLLFWFPARLPDSIQRQLSRFEHRLVIVIITLWQFHRTNPQHSPANDRTKNLTKTLQ